MNRGMYVLIVLLAVMLVTAVVFVRKINSDEQSADRGTPRLEKPPEVSLPPQEPENEPEADPVYTDEIGGEYLQQFSRSAPNWGAAVSLLADKGLLGSGRVGPIELADGKTWRLRKEIDSNVQSGAVAAAQGLRDEDGRTILAEFKEGDGKANARALVKLAVWLQQAQMRRAAFRKSADYTGLPATIEVSDALLYSAERPLDLGVIPGEILGRVVFRDCALRGVHFEAQEMTRLRFERCLIDSASRFVGTAKAPLEVSLTDCIVRADFSLEGGQIMTSNSLLADASLKLSEDVWARSSLQTSVVLGAQASDKRPRTEQGLAEISDGWVSESVLHLSSGDLDRLQRLKLIRDRVFSDIRAAARRSL